MNYLWCKCVLFFAMKEMRSGLVCLFVVAVAAAQSVDPSSGATAAMPFNVNGIFPALTSRNDMSTSLKMSEIGTGALMPWGDALYGIDYLRNPGSGSGAALWRVHANMTRENLAFHTSTFANRMIHRGTNSIVIGPYVIDAAGQVRVFEQLLTIRIGGMSEHLISPDTKAYMVGMEGQFWEVDLVNMTATQLFDLCDALHMCARGEQQHFKAAFTRFGATYVASNTFEEADYLMNVQSGSPFPGGGRLASWDGRSANWTILETTAFEEVTGRVTFGSVVYALGWDATSAILKVLDPQYPLTPNVSQIRGVPEVVSERHRRLSADTCAAPKPNTLMNLSHVNVIQTYAADASACCAKCTMSKGCAVWSFQDLYSTNCHLSPYAPWGPSTVHTNCTGGVIDPNAPIAPVSPPAPGEWQTYRLPKATHAYDHLWQTEWPRIREIETERYLMDHAGMFYELSPLGWAGSTWGVRPISQHLRMIPDYCSWNGFLVLGGNQVTPHSGANIITGQAQTNLWFGKSDDLWSFGKPRGWGGVWRNQLVQTGDVSDPFLMTGFDKKVVHVTADSSITINVQVDFTGTAGDGKVNEPWHPYTTIQFTGAGYQFHVFPDGFSAHWVRVLAIDGHANVTVDFHYT